MQPMTPEQWDFQKSCALSQQNSPKSNISENVHAWNKQDGYFSATLPLLKVFLQILKLFCKMVILRCQFLCFMGGHIRGWNPRPKDFKEEKVQESKFTPDRREIAKEI